MDRLETLRRQVAAANRSLPRHGLVVMHSGNCSGFDPQSGRVYIKPSGMDYRRIGPDRLVEVDVETGAVLSTHGLKPSVDLPHHLHLYRNLPDIRCVIHTHSNHATAFAACHRSIPLCLTAIADGFGTEIPCTPYLSNEGNEIGEAILRYRSSAPAILLGNHGVFAWGETVESALKTAVTLEDVAKTVILAETIGRVIPLPRQEAAKWHDRYQNRYGQERRAA